MTQEEKKKLIDKAAAWFADYLFIMGYENDWYKDTEIMISGEKEFYNYMMKE